MIKRDSIVQVLSERTSDGTGGSVASYEDLKKVDAHVSTATQDIINQYGLGSEKVLEVVTNQELSEDKDIRYKWDGRLFQIIRQVKCGNEWFSTFKEVIN